VIRELAAESCEIVYLTGAGVARRSLADLLPDAFDAKPAPRAGR
jgi:cytidine deaminase